MPKKEEQEIEFLSAYQKLIYRSLEALAELKHVTRTTRYAFPKLELQYRPATSAVKKHLWKVILEYSNDYGRAWDKADDQIKALNKKIVESLKPSLFFHHKGPTPTPQELKTLEDTHQPDAEELHEEALRSPWTGFDDISAYEAFMMEKTGVFDPTGPGFSSAAASADGQVVEATLSLSLEESK